MNPENPKLFIVAQSIMSSIQETFKSGALYSVFFDGDTPPRHIVYKKHIGKDKYPIVEIYDKPMSGKALTTFRVVTNGRYHDVVEKILHDVKIKEGFLFEIDHN